MLFVIVNACMLYTFLFLVYRQQIGVEIQRINDNNYDSKDKLNNQLKYKSWHKQKLNKRHFQHIDFHMMCNLYAITKIMWLLTNSLSTYKLNCELYQTDRSNSTQLN